ncbi:MAG: hypothetical protein L0G99_14340 [Propionibacteriales bacterium]|nr:hypothetical protein [Propionibacteriales bacterium]
MDVLGIEVSDDLVEAWRGWLMPEPQPFVVPADLAATHGWPDGRAAMTFEVLDSFELYRSAPDEVIVWLDRRAARSLPEAVRHGQPTPHRWPSKRLDHDQQRTVRRVERGRPRSRHTEVTPAQWRQATAVLPGARMIAGTFPHRSGPNCFGAVMGAAGVPGAAEEWMQPDTFDDWLSTSTGPGGQDDEVGTVLVWRSEAALPAHAGVSLGGGWFLHKPSQGWMSPTMVLRVRDGKYRARAPGLHLTRRRIGR